MRPQIVQGVLLHLGKSGWHRGIIHGGQGPDIGIMLGVVAAAEAILHSEKVGQRGQSGTHSLVLIAGEYHKLSLMEQGEYAGMEAIRKHILGMANQA